MAAAKKKAATKKAVKKSTVKKAAVKKKALKKSPPATKKAVAKKKSIKKAVAKKSVTKKAATKKVAPKKTAVKKKATTVKTPAPVMKKQRTVTTAKAEKKAAPAKRVAITAPTTTQGGFPPYIEKKGEEYMNEAQRAHFVRILEAWKTELMEEVDRTVHHMQDEAANFPDPNDRASQESEFALELRARDRERKLIKKIDESIGHLESEDYGYCNICGIEIGIRRLEARPTASLCIDCKTLDEIREKQIRG